MFNFVQKNTLFIKVVLGTIALTFVGFGVGSYTAATAEPYLAKVGDDSITQRDVERVLNGRPVDEATRRQILNTMIQQKLLLADADAAGLVVTPEALRRAIVQIEAFQEEGRFSAPRYQAYLNERNLTAAAFEQQVAQELLLQEQIEALGVSSVMSSTVQNRLSRVLSEVRDISAVIFQPEQYLSKVTVKDDEIRAVYDQETQRFRQEEAVKISYVEINLDALAQKISVPEEDIQKYFETHRDEFGREERKASHILISVAKGASDDERQKAKAQAHHLLETLKQQPQQFAELAQKHSQDPGSAARGGDLGFFARGVMVKPFEDAVFALKENEISELVESEFGYHLIRLTAVRQPKYADVRADVLQRLQKQRANTIYRRQVEEAGELAYQKPSSLAEVSQLLNVPIQNSDWLAKEAPQETVLSHPKLMEAIFSDDVFKHKNNSEAIEVAAGRTIIARILEHRPAARLPFESVRSNIRLELALKAAQKLAHEDGARVLAALKGGQRTGLGGITWEPAMQVSRAQLQGLTPEQAKLVFSIPLKKGDLSYAGGVLSNGSYMIYRLNQIVPPSDNHKTLHAELAARVSEIQAASEAMAYVSSLYRRFPVQLAALSSEADVAQ